MHLPLFNHRNQRLQFIDIKIFQFFHYVILISELQEFGVGDLTYPHIYIWGTLREHKLFYLLNCH